MLIDYKKELNPEQYEAVTTTEGPLLIIAGAGTGKTRTLIHRVAYLVENGVPAESILLITFTNKAANEMKERANKMLDGLCKGITACTYHSFCVKMLRIYGKVIGLDVGFTVMSSDETDIINIVKADMDCTKQKGFPNAKIIASMFSDCVNKDMDLFNVIHRDDKYKKYLEWHQELLEIRKLVCKYKKERNILGYDDLLTYMDQLLLNNPDVAEHISKKYRYIMVDEFQDSNTIQDRIVLNLRRINQNLAVVGDDMQSLYRFRGANVDNILTFPDRISGCKIITLNQNYRSTQEILDLSNHLMNYATEGYKKVLRNPEKKGVKPFLYSINGQMDEMLKILSIIEDRHESGIPYEDICVLFRNSAYAYGLETILTREGYSFVKYGGTKFLEREHIKDILAYLRVLTNHKDEIAWFRILQVHSGIGSVYAKRIAANCKDNMDYLLSPSHRRKAYSAELSILYDELKLLLPMDFDSALKEIINFYIATVKRNILNMKTKDEGNRTEMLENLKQHEDDFKFLIELAATYSNMVKFLDDLTLDNNPSGNSDVSSEDNLVLSTIHSIKGLEFDTVIIMDCIDEMFPSTGVFDIGTDEDNDELRCFYVAVTRAKNYLYLMVPKTCSKYGKTIYGQKSHFLNGSAMFVKNIDCVC